MSTESADEPAGSAEVDVDGAGREVAPEVPQEGSGSRRRPLLLVAGAALVVVAVIAVMVVFGEPGDSGSAAPTRGHASTLEPLALGDEPIWTADRLAGRTVTDSPAMTIRDDVVLLRSHMQFSVLDMATGQVHWSISNVPKTGTGEELPGLAGAVWWPWLDGPFLLAPGGAPAILTDYWNLPETGRNSGVALLSAETGEVLWRKDIPHFAGLGAADDHTALVAVTTGNGLNEVDDLGVLKTLALDMGTGETRWEQSGVLPDAVSGDTALGHRSLKRHSSLADDETTVVALDLNTGAQKWDLSERLARSRLVQAARTPIAVMSRTVGSRRSADQVLSSTMCPWGMRRRVVGIVAVVIGLLFLASLTAYLVVVGLDKADKIASVIGALCGVIGLGVGLSQLFRRPDETRVVATADRPTVTNMVIGDVSGRVEQFGEFNGNHFRG